VSVPMMGDVTHSSAAVGTMGPPACLPACPWGPWARLQWVVGPSMAGMLATQSSHGPVVGFWLVSGTSLLMGGLLATVTNLPPAPADHVAGAAGAAAADGGSDDGATAATPAKSPPPPSFAEGLALLRLPAQQGVRACCQSPCARARGLRRRLLLLGLSLVSGRGRRVCG
jgi:hypothetical protein